MQHYRKKDRGGKVPSKAKTLSNNVAPGIFHSLRSLLQARSESIVEPKAYEEMDLPGLLNTPTTGGTYADYLNLDLGYRGKREKGIRRLYKLMTLRHLLEAQTLQGPPRAIKFPYLLKGPENRTPRFSSGRPISLIFPCGRALCTERHNRCYTVERSLIGSISNFNGPKSGA